MPRIDVQPRQRVALPELLLLLLRRAYHSRRDHQSLNALCGIPDGRHDRRPSAIPVVLVEQRNGGGLDERRRLIGRDFDAGEARVAVLRERFTGIRRFVAARHWSVFGLEDADEVLQLDFVGGFGVALLLLLVFGDVHADWRRRQAADSSFDRFRQLDDFDLFGFRFKFFFQVADFARCRIVEEIIGFFRRGILGVLQVVFES